jgi:hypothetical protein
MGLFFYCRVGCLFFSLFLSYTLRSSGGKAFTTRSLRVPGTGSEMRARHLTSCPKPARVLVPGMVREGRLGHAGVKQHLVKLNMLQQVSL